ncbi:MAG: class I SAM-dependent methyltransferase [Blastocatellia bacterium]
MGLIGGRLGYYLLRRMNQTGENARLDGSAYANKSKLETLLGDRFWQDIKDKVVVDFGCGVGAESIEMALRGARKVIGVDIQERLLAVANEQAIRYGVKDRCTFVTTTNELADVIVSIDSFEHFSDPAAILEIMRGMLKPDGCVVVAFGPPWYHPLGGHLFSVFPWAHLLFTEQALIRWRSDFRTDGATRFQEVEGGLNLMTVRGFENLIRESPFEFAQFEAAPIKKLRPLSSGLTREFTTAMVKCKLTLRG